MEKESVMKHYVVTGGVGFIGSHLVEHLAVDNYVTVIDDLSVGKMENLKNVHEQFPDNVKFLHGSITDLSFLQDAVKGAIGIFHHAALASVPASIAEPKKSHDVNATGTLNVLIAARDNGVKKVVFASSSAVYGDAAQPPIDEHSPISPLSPYAVQKHLGEEYCTIFTELYGLETVCLRYFNVYGSRQNPHSTYAAVIPKFIYSVQHNTSPVIYGDGTQTRDFVHVSDVVRANIMAMESSGTGIYNVAEGTAITIK
jgi:UDP-glucose 4-epimerase